MGFELDKGGEDEAVDYAGDEEMLPVFGYYGEVDESCSTGAQEEDVGQDPSVETVCSVLEQVAGWGQLACGHGTRKEAVKKALKDHPTCVAHRRGRVISRPE